MAGCKNTLGVSVDGSGTVKSVPPATAEADVGINCIGPNDPAAPSGSCNRDILQSVTVTLRAEAPSGWAFSRWEGDCTGSSSDCTFKMDADRTVNAVFAEQFTLTVNRTGGGAVRAGVTDDPTTFVNPLIDCGPNCTSQSAIVPSTTRITITAFMSAPLPPGSTITWGDACAGTVGPTCFIENMPAQNVTVGVRVP